jgi:hypothetical protein
MNVIIIGEIGIEWRIANIKIHLFHNVSSKRNMGNIMHDAFINNIITEFTEFGDEFIRDLYDISYIKLDQAQTDERLYAINTRWSEIERILETLVEHREYDTLSENISVTIRIERWVTLLSGYFKDFVTSKSYDSLAIDHWIHTGLFNKLNEYAHNNKLVIVTEVETNYYKIVAKLV